MNLPPVQPSEPTSSQATAFSNQLTTTDDYHSFQVFIPKGKSTTAWIEWCRENGLNFWLGTSAAQFKVSETAKIFNIDSTEKYEYLLKNFPHAEDDNYIDWERVATEFDAVHCTEDFFIPGWDCESTAWFNKEKLAFQKSISSQEIDL
ncbi:MULTISPECIES: hypothetical protein [unclassified Endozoicomonas]|uniref:hypothetical protein n=1 Tax=unclassified Endozoicomonas TaxID=2644528 RepID=UPI002148D600|nr:MULTISPECIES: hypothetical protein [unclassified Endozoicomonas]